MGQPTQTPILLWPGVETKLTGVFCPHAQIKTRQLHPGFNGRNLARSVPHGLAFEINLVGFRSDRRPVQGRQHQGKELALGRNPFDLPVFPAGHLVLPGTRKKKKKIGGQKLGKFVGGICRIGGEPAGSNITLFILTEINRRAHAGRKRIRGKSQGNSSAIFHLLLDGKSILPRQPENPANRHLSSRLRRRGKNDLLRIGLFQTPDQPLPWRTPAPQLKNRIR